MKHHFLLLGMLLTTHVLSAQTIQRQVVSSGGGYTSNATASISSTVGDLVINTSTVGSFTITQGFQQDETAPTGVDDVKINVNYQLYPNPASDEITLSLQSSTDVALSCAIYDVNGRVLHRFNNEGDKTKTYKHTFNISGYAAGNYFLKIVDMQGRSVHTIPFTKQ